MKNSTEKAKIAQYMSRKICSISEVHDIREAAKLMLNNDCRHLIVKDKEGKDIGLVSEKELQSMFFFFGGTDALLTDILRKKPFIISENDSVAKIAGYMSENREDGAIVQDETGKTVGIFTTTDALRHLGDQENNA